MVAIVVAIVTTTARALCAVNVFFASNLFLHKLIFSFFSGETPLQYAKKIWESVSVAIAVALPAASEARVGIDAFRAVSVGTSDWVAVARPLAGVNAHARLVRRRWDGDAAAVAEICAFASVFRRDDAAVGQCEKETEKQPEDALWESH